MSPVPTRRSASGCAAFLGLLLGAGAAALPGDSQQPIRIDTREAVRDETSGETLYRGEVRMTQGSLVIAAETVRLQEQRSRRDPDASRDPLAGSDVFRITARGNPAHMRQVLTAGEPAVEADARLIEYFQPRSLVRLRNAVRLRKGRMRLDAARVDYLIDEQRIVAYSNARSGQRVRTVMPAERLRTDPPAETLQ